MHNDRFFFYRVGILFPFHYDSLLFMYLEITWEFVGIVDARNSCYLGSKKNLIIVVQSFKWYASSSSYEEEAYHFLFSLFLGSDMHVVQNHFFFITTILVKLKRYTLSVLF